MAEEVKYQRVRVTNLSPGPRFFHTKSGTVTLDPIGRGPSSWEGEVSETELENMKQRRAKEFAIGEPTPDTPAPVHPASGAGKVDLSLDKMTDEELRAYVEKRDGKPASPNTSRANLLKMAAPKKE